MAELTFMQRILKARKQIMDSGISKDKPGFKFHYVDLPQIEAKVNEACTENNILVWFDFSDGKATLLMYDALNEQATPFTTSVTPKDVEMKTQPIQDTGAMITYMRRYLYMTAFQISEHDMIDGNQEQPEAVQKAEKRPAEAKGSNGLTAKRMLDDLDLARPGYGAKLCAAKGVESTDELTIEYIEKAWNKICKPTVEAVNNDSIV